MKYIIFSILLSLVPFLGYAERIIKVETFNEGESKFGFDAYADKKCSATFDGEHLVLKSKKNDFYYGKRFPIIVRENFEITYKLILSNIDDKHSAGLVFNYDEESEQLGDAITISENKMTFQQISRKRLHSNYLYPKAKIRSEKIKLKKGRNIEMEIVIKKRGRKIVVTVNGVDFDESDIMDFRRPDMGFFVTEGTQLLVDEVKIVQDIREED